MKIAYDDQIFGRQSIGGISRYILEVASRLTSLDADIDVLISSGLSINKLIDEFHVKKFGLTIKNQNGYRLRNEVNKLISQVALSAFKPNVIHETYYRTARVGPPKATRVITIHDMAHEAMPNETNWAEMESEWKAKAIERSDGIICISEATKTELLNFYPSLEKTKPIQVIHHGCAYLEPTENGLQQLRNTVGAKPYILYVGQRGNYKRFTDLVQAFSIINSKNTFNLVAFGGGPFSPGEIANIEKHGLSVNNVLHCSGSDDILNAAYKCCSAFVYPSVYEGFGIPILEALAAGRPVICSDIAAFKEIGNNDVNYFKAGDAEHLSRKLTDTLMENPTKQQAINKFSWGQSARQHIEFYKYLRGTSPRQSSHDLFGAA